MDVRNFIPPGCLISYIDTCITASSYALTRFIILRIYIVYSIHVMGDHLKGNNYHIR
jgi:hypothetical protein